jgi:hypothetical protein
MPDREATLERYLEIWNGSVGLDELDVRVTPTFVGHMGSSDRDLARLLTESLSRSRTHTLDPNVWWSYVDIADSDGR